MNLVINITVTVPLYKRFSGLAVQSSSVCLVIVYALFEQCLMMRYPFY